MKIIKLEASHVVRHDLPGAPVMTALVIWSCQGQFEIAWLDDIDARELANSVLGLGK